MKTATVQTEVIDGFQILRSKDCTLTMQSLTAWTKALKRKYDHLTVSCNVPCKAAANIMHNVRSTKDRKHAMPATMGCVFALRNAHLSAAQQQSVSP